MSEKVKCPYCGNEIYNDAEQCEFCKEYFAEPEIKNIKLTSLGQFIVFSCLLPGVYAYLWSLLNYKSIINIASSRDRAKLKTMLILALPFCIVAGIINPIVLVITAKIFLLGISYRILRIIEKYSLIKYNSAVTHNEYGWFIFDVLYIVYFLGTYPERVHTPGMRMCFNINNWIKYSLIFLLGIGIAVMLTYYLSFIDIG